MSIQLGSSFNRGIPEKQVKIIFPKNVDKLIIIMLGLSLAGVLSNVSQHSLKFDIANMMLLSHENAVSRYDGSLNVTLLYKVSSIFAFFTTFLLGALASHRFNKRTLLFIIMHFGVLLLDSILMAARAGMLLQLFCFLATLFSFTYYTNSRVKYKITLKKIAQAIMFITVIFLFFVVIQVFRGGKSDFDITGIMSHVLTWFVGYVPCFDIWIRSSFDYDLTFGQKTFVGLFDLLGISERVSGVYPAVDIGNERFSNVFTAYRGLIEDFSLLGMHLILLITGVLLSLIPSYVSKTKRITTMPLTAFIVFFFFWSYVINPYSYNVILFGSIIFWIYFVIFIRAVIID